MAVVRYDLGQNAFSGQLRYSARQVGFRRKVLIFRLRSQFLSALAVPFDHERTSRQILPAGATRLLRERGAALQYVRGS